MRRQFDNLLAAGLDAEQWVEASREEAEEEHEDEEEARWAQLTLSHSHGAGADLCKRSRSRPLPRRYKQTTAASDCLLLSLQCTLVTCPSRDIRQ